MFLLSAGLNWLARRVRETVPWCEANKNWCWWVWSNQNIWWTWWHMCICLSLSLSLFIYIYREKCKSWFKVNKLHTTYNQIINSTSNTYLMATGFNSRILISLGKHRHSSRPLRSQRRSQSISLYQFQRKLICRNGLDGLMTCGRKMWLKLSKMLLLCRCPFWWSNLVVLPFRENWQMS